MPELSINLNNNKVNIPIVLLRNHYWGGREEGDDFKGMGTQILPKSRRLHFWPKLEKNCIYLIKINN